MGLKDICLLVTCNACENTKKLIDSISDSGVDYRVYLPNENLGYLNGGLFGLSKYEEEGNSYEWGIICNTDIDIEDKSFLTHIESYNNSTLWGLAPNVVRKSNGNKQNPFLKERISKKRVHLYKLIYERKWAYKLFFFLVKIKRVILKKEVVEVHSSYIYAMDGSIFILRKPFIDTIINTQNDIFMYGEEIFIAELAYRNNKKIYYDEYINIVHNEKATTSLIGIGKKQKWFMQSYNYLWKEFFSKA